MQSYSKITINTHTLWYLDFEQTNITKHSTDFAHRLRREKFDQYKNKKIKKSALYKDLHFISRLKTIILQHRILFE